jgi:hypothetical protein
MITITILLLLANIYQCYRDYKRHQQQVSQRKNYYTTHGKKLRHDNRK